MEVVPGIHRLGNGLVNVYLLQEAGGVTIVDTDAPGQWIRKVATFRDGATLDLPGSPRVVHVPGHTAGSAALYLPALDAILAGDAIATRNVMSGQTGPQLAPFGASRREALASLARLEGLAARYVLPGHGEPWAGGVQEAVRIVMAVEATR